jgi:hypothetical protein
MSLIPVLLVIHVALALGLLLPSIVLPFVLRPDRSGSAPAGPAVRGLLALQARGTVAIGIGLALSGAALLAAVGADLVSRPWLLVALAIYAANLVVAFFVQRPSLRRLLRIRGGEDGAWRTAARRQRMISYGMAALTGTIGFLMSTKPVLW